MTTSYVARAEQLYQQAQALNTVLREGQDSEWCYRLMDLRERRVQCIDDLFFDVMEDLRLKRTPDRTVLQDRVTAIQHLKTQWTMTQDIENKIAALEKWKATEQQLEK